MGHLQRGGTPTPLDRVFATQLGSKTVDLITAKKFGYMPGMRMSKLVPVALKDVAKGIRTVPLDCPLIRTARALDTCFGDPRKC